MYQQQIREMYNQFSASYCRVADFILNNYRDVAFMTAAQVAAACRVDAALVVRFAQRLGYPGYPELLKAVQEDVKRDLQAVYEPAPEEKTPWAVFQRNLIEDRNSLAHVLLHVEVAQVEKVVELLSHARRITVAAEGTTIYAAQTFVLRLSALGFNAFVLPIDITARTAMLAGLHRDDLLIGLGLLEISPGVGVVLELAHEEGIPTVAIVASYSSATARVADVVIQTPARGTGLMPSGTATLAVLSALVQALAIQLGDRTADYALCFEKYYTRLAAEVQNSAASLPRTLAQISSRKFDAEFAAPAVP
jgi:DNA-binding MurR/RpiR family transcriptional regulator